jgi:XTP/dITP diphosphohydrolase
VTFPERLVIASRNAGKVREILRICRDWPVEWLTHEDVSLPDVDETGETYLENALLKARAVAAATGEAALADDSGIEVDALQGAPGPRSARYSGPGATEESNLQALLRAMEGVPPERRTARYRAVAAVAWPNGEVVWAEGVCDGRLRIESRGTGGFGYDPIFEPDGEERSMAELAPGEKDRISHRGRALRALREKLTERRTPRKP